MATASSSNFVFLDVHDPQFVRLGRLAERYFPEDLSTCLLKLRQFTELLAQLADLVIEFVGVAEFETIRVKCLDENYFAEN